MKRKIDSKYEISIDLGADTFDNKLIQIRNVFNGNVIPEDEPLFIFRAKDRLAIRALQYYLALCVHDECTSEQLLGIKKMIGEFHRFAVDNPDKMKQPGSTMPEDMKKLKEGYGGIDKVEPPLNE